GPVQARCAEQQDQGKDYRWECSFELQSLIDMTQNVGAIASNNRSWGNILRDHAARTDNGILTNAGVGEDRGSGSDRCTFLHDRALHLPVGLGLQFPFLGSRAWIAVVDE